MRSWQHIGIFFLGFLLIFALVRGLLRMVIDVYLSSKAINKRYKNQNIIEWFTYKKFRDVLPKRYFVWYVLQIAFFLIGILITVIMDFLNVSEPFLRVPMGIYFIGSTILIGFFDFIWYDKKTKEYNPEKTLGKKKSNKK
jgi:cytochrome c biogenesis protein CcdA